MEYSEPPGRALIFRNKGLKAAKGHGYKAAYYSYVQHLILAHALGDVQIILTKLRNMQQIEHI